MQDSQLDIPFMDFNEDGFDPKFYFRLQEQRMCSDLSFVQIIPL